MKDNGEKRWQTYLKNLPKPVGIGIFFGICGMVAILILAHNNPLAPDQHTEDLKKYCACALLVLACIIFGLYYDRMFIIPRELYHSRKLIWKLSKNDFKKRYAGSYLGFVWALVQPVVTVVMYWLVFDKVFNTKAQMLASGVEVPYELGLLGHSDADVLAHAISDAILGAAALGDIGKLFPDSDPEYEGADSLKLLEKVCARVRQAGFDIGNLDSTVIAQRPKLAPYIDRMRENLAAACGIDPGRVSVKATTEEGLGFTGSGEGIAASAVCLLEALLK